MRRTVTPLRPALGPVVVNIKGPSALRAMRASPADRMISRSYERPMPTPDRSPRNNYQRQYANMQRHQRRSRSPGFQDTPESLRKYLLKSNSASLDRPAKGSPSLGASRSSRMREESPVVRYKNPLFGHSIRRQVYLTPSPGKFRTYEGVLASAAKGRVNKALHYQLNTSQKPFTKILGKYIYKNTDSKNKPIGSLYYLEKDKNGEMRRRYYKEWNHDLKDAYAQQLNMNRSRLR
jgi:hypothetical protein